MQNLCNPSFLLEALAHTLDCSHRNVVCLNHYETFRKYLCHDCGEVLICECEKELALRFRPHQIAYGTEFGTHNRHKVTGFSPNICSVCRGEKEEAHPMAYGGSVERYYWREIDKTYWEMISKWLAEKRIPIENSLLFESKFSEEAKLMKREAKRIWQKRHEEAPLDRKSTRLNSSHTT